MEVKKVIELENYIGVKFNNWKVIGVGKTRHYKNGKSKKTLTCVCECGSCNKKEKDIIIYELLDGSAVGCKKQRNEKIGEKNKKYNTFNLEGDYGIGYTSKGEEFYFDKDDFELIKDYCWFKKHNGYIQSHVKNSTKVILLHNLIMNAEPYNIDHINRIRHDNRKNNLRYYDCLSQNSSNCNVRKNNKSGITGVWWDEKNEIWLVSLQYQNENHNLGSFTDKELAIKTRLNAEKLYMGEFAPQKHLFEQYGIN